jgi:NACHT domain- and WD repeat-containing protein
VYPRLEELCALGGARFQAIDLRWGVSGEAARNQQTINICLTEVDRCREVSPRPNFIVLLGDRYGWCPPPPQIPAHELETLLGVAGAQRPTLEKWYLKDENAIPPEYVLKERTGELEAARRWAEVERTLTSALRRAGMDVPSATEREVERELQTVPDAPEHVFCFFRRLANWDDLLGDVSPERVERPTPETPLAEDFLDLVDPETDRRPDAEAGERLRRLKAMLTERLPGNVDEYEARWAGDGITTGHLAQLCDDVWSRLSRVISQELEELEDEDTFAREREAHRAFGSERAQHFTGREDVLKQIETYLAGVDRHPLAVYGPSGSGKSALLAKAVDEAERYHGVTLVHRFVGATPESSEGRALLAGLCRELAPDTPPADYQALVDEFPKRLARAGAEQPLILFLDALDQLSDADRARTLIWLPAELPPNVRVVVSAISPERSRPRPKGADALGALKTRLPAGNLVALQPMTPEEGGRLLGRWLFDAGRRLRADQREEVLSKFRAEGRPLYLRLAFEEARRWRWFTPEEETVLADGIPEIIRENLFRRLSRARNHGEVLVAHSLGYLAAAKDGLSEDELLTVLSEQDAVLDDFRAREPESPPVDRLPFVVWSRLYHDLEPYLGERTADGASVLSFYHRQLRQVAADDYLADEEGRRRHRELARHFGDEPLVHESAGTRTPNLRKLSELPFQQTQGELWDELLQTLTDFEFLERKAADYGAATGAEGEPKTYTGVFSLGEDFALALEKMPWEGRRSGGRRRIVVTGADLGDGLVVRCPHCHESVPWNDEWRGKDEACPLCGGPWKVNRFVAERRGWT